MNPAFKFRLYGPSAKYDGVPVFYINWLFLQRFYGTSMDKKSAKQLAAKQALEDLFNWIPPPKE